MFVGRLLHGGSQPGILARQELDEPAGHEALFDLKDIQESVFLTMAEQQEFQNPKAPNPIQQMDVELAVNEQAPSSTEYHAVLKVCTEENSH